MARRRGPFDWLLTIFGLFLLGVIVVESSKEKPPPPPLSCVEDRAGYMAALLVRRQMPAVHDTRHQNLLAWGGNTALVWLRANVAPTCIAFRFTDCEHDRAEVLFVRPCSDKPLPAAELAELKRRAGLP